MTLYLPHEPSPNYTNPNPYTSTPSIPSLPVGFRFAPKDHELLNHYLAAKINGEYVSLGIPHITEVDICSDHPSKIFMLGESTEKGEDEDEDDEKVINRYFFSQLKKTTENGSRFNRKVCNNYGTWKGQNTQNILVPKTKVLLGYNKYYKYVPDKNHRAEEDTEVEWLMHEYSFCEYQETVICRISKKVDRKKLGKKRAIEGEMSIIVAEDHKEPSTKRSRLEAYPSMSQDDQIPKEVNIEEQQHMSLKNINADSVKDLMNSNIPLPNKEINDEDFSKMDGQLPNDQEFNDEHISVKDINANSVKDLMNSNIPILPNQEFNVEDFSNMGSQVPNDQEFKNEHISLKDINGNSGIDELTNLFVIRMPNDQENGDCDFMNAFESINFDDSTEYWDWDMLGSQSFSGSACI